MADRYVSVAGGGDGTSPGSRWTLAQANSNLVAGDTAHLAPGTYTTTIRPAVSGSNGNPITYQGEGAGVVIATTANDMVRLEDRPDVTLHTLEFESVGHGWVWTNGNSHRISFIDCTFDSNPPDGETWGAGNDFVAITARGDFLTFSGCTIHKWLGGDGLLIFGSNALVEDSYFGLSGHGALHCQGDYYVVQRCYFRNKWNRAAHFGPANADSGARLRGLVQDCIFFDNNWIDESNEGYPVDGWAENVDTDPHGDGQITKTGGSGLIFRNNLFVRSHTYTSGSNIEYRAALQIGNFGDTEHWEHMRFYHNSFVDDELHPGSVTYNTNNDFHAKDNRFYNNVMYPIATDKIGTDNSLFYFNVTSANDGSGSYNFMDTWEFRGNLSPRTIHHGSGNPDMSIAAFESAFPSQASDNVAATPAFVDDDYSAAVADLDVLIDRDNLRLTAASAGKGAAVPLATVTANSSGTTLTVSDTYMFSDGNGVIPGDLLSIDGQTTRVTNVVDEDTLTVDTAITVSSGDEIWLADYGENTDIGIQSLEEGSDSDGGGGTVADLAVQVIGSQVEEGTLSNSLTTGVISPAADSLIILAIGGTNTGAWGPPLVSNVSSPLSIAGSWTQIASEQVDAGTDALAYVWMAQASGTPGTGTITVTWDDDTNNRTVVVLEVVGHDSESPVVQSASFNDNASTVAVDLSTAPASDNLVIGTILSRGDGGGVVPGAGFTELFDQTAGGSAYSYQVQYTDAPADATVDWTDVGFLSVGAILEIAAGELPVYTGVGDGTLPALTASGAGAFTSLPGFAGVGDVTLPALTADGMVQVIAPPASRAASAAITLPMMRVRGVVGELVRKQKSSRPAIKISI